MSRKAEQMRQVYYARSDKKLRDRKHLLPIIIFIILSYSGYKNFYLMGLMDQHTQNVMTELGLMNYKNSGVIWYGIYSYFNDNPVLDLLYKTRDCKYIGNRGEFYPGHNKYDYLKDTGLKYYIGELWRPNIYEIEYVLKNFKKYIYKNVTIYEKNDETLIKSRK